MTVALNTYMSPGKSRHQSKATSPREAPRQLCGHVYVQGILTLLPFGVSRLLLNSGVALGMVTMQRVEVGEGWCRE